MTRRAGLGRSLGSVSNSGFIPGVAELGPASGGRWRGSGGGVTSDDKAKIAALEWEVRELRRANTILRQASAYFAKAELDRPQRGRNDAKCQGPDPSSNTARPHEDSPCGGR